MKFPRRLRAQEAVHEPFKSLNDTVPLLEQLDYRPIPGELPGQYVIPVENERLEYDLTVTQDPAAAAVYLGAELHHGVRLNEQFATDLLAENYHLNHAKLSVEANEGRDTYRIVVNNEIRTPFLTKVQFVDGVRAFDAAVTYSFEQIDNLAQKAGVDLDEVEQPRVRRKRLG